MASGREHGTEKFIQPQVSIVPEVPDVGIHRYQFHVGIPRDGRHMISGPFVYMVFHPPFDHSPDVESVD